MADQDLTRDYLAEYGWRNRKPMVFQEGERQQSGKDGRPKTPREIGRQLREDLEEREALQTDSWTPEHRPNGPSDLPSEYKKDPAGQQQQREFELKLKEKQSPLRHTDYTPPDGFQPMFPQTVAEFSPLKPYTG